MTTITVNLKTVSGEKHSIESSSVAAVKDFKQLVADKTGIPVAQQKLIFAGQVLKDDRTIDSYGIQDGLTVHLVKTAAPPTSSIPTTSTPSSTQATPTQTSMPPFAGLNPGMGLGNPASFQQMQQQLLQNPNMMREVLNSPLTQQLMQNPELMRMMLASNPQMREIIERNPEIGHILNDPATLRQTMELARNPELMREMMRTSDRAMGNLESLPGGFDFLRRMYTNVQEPLLNAATPSTSTTPTAQPTTTPTTPLTAPNTTPLPNPWGGAGGLGDTTGRQPVQPVTPIQPQPQAQPPTQPPTQQTQSQPQQSPFPFPPMMGLGGGPEGFDPATLSTMISNPEFQTMLQTMLQNPQTAQLMEQMLLSNPQMQPLFEMNPELRNHAPEMIRMLSNPQYLQQMLQLQSQLGNSFPGFLGAPTTPTATTPLSPFSMFPSGGASTVATPPVSQEPPEVRYRVQLQQLRDMGFQDTQLNIELLQQNNGDVNRTLDRLFGM